jgi:hypothetical protein
MSTPPPAWTERQADVHEELRQLLERTDYRMGALVLTCAPEPGKGDVRIVGVVGMKEVDTRLAPDLVALPKRLRQIADEIEALVQGKAPLPEQPR